MGERLVFHQISGLKWRELSLESRTHSSENHGEKLPAQDWQLWWLGPAFVCLSWQRQSWGTEDCLEPKRPQLSPLHLPVVTVGRPYWQGTMKHGLFSQHPVTKMYPATFNFQCCQHQRVALVSSVSLHQPRQDARSCLHCALNRDKRLAELPDHQTPKSLYIF